MKKLRSTIATLALIFMIPAVFIGYLYNDTPGSITNPVAGSKTEQVNTYHETGFTPGPSFLLKG